MITGCRLGTWLAWMAMSEIGCAPAVAHYDLDELKRQVTFETDCPGELIEIQAARDVRVLHSQFEIMVCGQSQRWQSYGDNYYPIGQGLSD